MYVIILPTVRKIEILSESQIRNNGDSRALELHIL